LKIILKFRRIVARKQTQGRTLEHINHCVSNMECCKKRETSLERSWYVWRD